MDRNPPPSTARVEQPRRRSSQERAHERERIITLEETLLMRAIARRGNGTTSSCGLHVSRPRTSMIRLLIPSSATTALACGGFIRSAARDQWLRLTFRARSSASSGKFARPLDGGDQTSHAPIAIHQCVTAFAADDMIGGADRAQQILRSMQCRSHPVSKSKRATEPFSV